jgi:hypothetical protein
VIGLRRLSNVAVAAIAVAASSSVGAGCAGATDAATGRARVATTDGFHGLVGDVRDGAIANVDVLRDGAFVVRAGTAPVVGAFVWVRETAGGDARCVPVGSIPAAGTSVVEPDDAAAEPMATATARLRDGLIGVLADAGAADADAAAAIAANVATWCDAPGARVLAVRRDPRLRLVVVDRVEFVTLGRAAAIAQWLRDRHAQANATRDAAHRQLFASEPFLAAILCRVLADGTDPAVGASAAELLQSLAWK